MPNRSLSLQLDSPQARRQQNRQLIILATALVLSMSTWFSTAAVLPELRGAWQLDSSAAAWLTIAVQLGFVAGAFLLAATGVADRIRPRRLILIGSLGAATANVSIVVMDSVGPALVARAVTGAFLAAVYPSALNAMSAWFAQRRGLALGVLGLEEHLRGKSR